MTSIRRHFVSLALALLLPAAAGVAGAQHLIETYAGGGPDDVAALAAAIGVPTAVALDASGNTYIATWSHRVFKIDAAGHLTVLAGIGLGGFSGDGGPARDAMLNTPTGVAVDSAGNVYICDWNNARIRRVDALTLKITTIAGGGIDVTDGVLATTAGLGGPNGVAVDGAGQIYIAETGANRIRKVDAAGTITTIATGALNFPMAVAVDGAGNLFVADTSNGRVQKVDASGVVSTAAVASFPSGVAVAGGVLYVAEQNSARVFQVAAGITTTVAGTGLPSGFSGDGGLATNAKLSHGILGLTADASGNVVIADSYNARVRRVDAASGNINTVAGNGHLTSGGDGGPATKASLTVTGLAVDATGNVYFPDAGRIRRVTAATGVIDTLAGSNGIAVEGFGIAADGAGGWLVADFAGHQVRRINSSGTITTVAGTGQPGFSGDGLLAAGARLNGPTAVAVDAAGNIYIADTFNHRVRKVDGAGMITTVAGDGSTGLPGPTFSPHADGVQATVARVWNPTGLAFRNGNMYIAEQFGHRVRMVNTLGVITTFAGGGSGGDGDPASAAQLGRPTTLAFDTLGNLYITETELTLSRVRRVDTSGTIETIAGTGAPGFSGDGGPATLATFALLSPWGVAVDGSGNVLLGDRFNFRIRRVTNQAPVADAGDDVVATAGVPFTLSGDGSSDADSDALSYEWVDEFGVVVATLRDVTLTRGPGTYVFTLTASDSSTSRSDDVIVSINNTPAGSNVSVTPIDASTGAAPVTVTFSSVTQPGITSLTMSSGGPAPPAGFQLGTPPVYYELTTTAVFTGSINVCIDYTGIVFAGAPALYHLENGVMVDRTTPPVDLVNEIVCGTVTSLSPFALFQQAAPPVIEEVRPDVRELWPANHRMVTVKFTVEAHDDSGVTPSCNIAQVTSNESVNGQGDGDLSPDWLITEDLTVQLRAERSGRGSGRVYTVTIRCEDNAGNSASATSNVRVTHDRRR